MLLITRSAMALWLIPRTLVLPRKLIITCSIHIRNMQWFNITKQLLTNSHLNKIKTYPILNLYLNTPRRLPVNNFSENWAFQWTVSMKTDIVSEQFQLNHRLPMTQCRDCQLRVFVPLIYVFLLCLTKKMCLNFLWGLTIRCGVKVVRVCF